MWSFFSSINVSQSSEREIGSIPDVGSSRIIVLQLPKHARAIESFRFIPPEKVVAANCLDPTHLPFASMNLSILKSFNKREYSEAIVSWLIPLNMPMIVNIWRGVNDGQK